MRSYTWHPQRKKWRYGFAVLAVALAVIVWLATRAEPEIWPPRLLASFFALVAVALLIEQDTHVDADSRAIIREGRLFGRFRVWRWRHHFSEFTEVAMSRTKDPEGGDMVLVGLRRQSGRLMAVRYFYTGTGEPNVEAERVARSLAEATGLHLNDEVA